MNTALNIRDVGPEIKEALAAKAKSEGKTMSALAKQLLADGLGVKPESPAERWNRENAAAIAAHNASAEQMHARLSAISAVPTPDFADEDADDLQTNQSHTK